MKANELVTQLRIGNLINYHYKNYDEDGNIESEGDEISPIDAGDFENINENYLPIPLTEEWHNKFGVQKNGFNNFEYELPLTRIAIKTLVVFTQDYVVIRSYDGGEKPSMDDNLVTIWNKDKMKRDMFVHEWQNIFHALTGEELTQ